MAIVIMAVSGEYFWSNSAAKDGMWIAERDLNDGSGGNSD